MRSDNRLRKIGFALILIAAGPIVLTGSSDEKHLEAIRRRGVLFYLPFDGSAEAALSVGNGKPWSERGLSFIPGRFGGALRLQTAPVGPAKRSDRNSTRKPSNLPSILAYEALGNVYARRGTISFWVRTPWAGSSRQMLSGPSLAGPTIFAISSEAHRAPFLYFQRRKAYFDCTFGGRLVAGKLERFGTLGSGLVPLWKENVWQHFAVTWDDRRGLTTWLNGEPIDQVDRAIEWKMFQPDLISLATRALDSRDLWPVSTSADFDEFIVFNRPLTANEIELVRDGKYLSLRETSEGDWPFDPEARRTELHLQPSGNRPAQSANAAGTLEAAIRQVPVEEVGVDFHRRYALIDGSAETAVRFESGGLSFERAARFQFEKEETFDHLVSAMGDSNGSFGLENSGALQLPDGYSHHSLERKERADFAVRFAGNSEAREFTFYDLHARPASGGRPYHLASSVETGRFADARHATLRWPHPDDAPAIMASSDPPSTSRSIGRKALHPTFIVLEAPKHDVFVEAVRLVLWLRPTAKKFLANMAVFDPQMPGRAAFEIDLGLETGSELLKLDLSLYPNGLVIPPRGHAVVRFTADSDFTLLYGGRTDSRIELVGGDSKTIGHEFAQAMLLRMWPAYLRRLNQNSFMTPVETEASNPIKTGLDRALRYDPGNERANAWYDWSRLRPWPEYDFTDLDRQRGPRWAVYGREAIRSAQAIIHWWLDHRAHPSGYLVGGGNQWNDVTKLYNKFLFLCGVTEDERLLDAIERYLDAHWNSGRMVDGFTRSMTDVPHSVEEASYLQPAFEVLRPGVPRHVYRDLRTASNLRKWLGTNGRGHTHFRSNFFNASNLLLDGIHGRDVVMNESALVPAQYLAWYTGHPEASRLLRAWTDAWLEDTSRESDRKPAGAVPAWVKLRTEECGVGHVRNELVYDRFIAAWQQSGDQRFLDPITQLLEKREALGDRKWFSRNCNNLISWRILTGDESHDDLLLELAAAGLERQRRDAFFQRGIEQAEGEALLAWVIDRDDAALLESLRYVIRNNRRSLPIYGPTDPPTDRVYPWGRTTLPVMMLGGRLFDSRASDPQPTAAIVWEGIDSDVISLVFEVEPKGLKMMVHNFKGEPVAAGLRPIGLPEGVYRIGMAPDTNADRLPDRPPTVSERALHRFGASEVLLPPGTTYVELSCVRCPDAGPRPDLAVTVGKAIGKTREVVAVVHNLGPVPATNFSVRLSDDNGMTLADRNIDELSGLTGFEARTLSVTLRVPEGIDPATLTLRVDPDDVVREINEFNNTYPVKRGVPPPVESSLGAARD